VSPKRAKKRAAKPRRPKQAAARRGTRSTAARPSHRKAAKKSAPRKAAKKSSPRKTAKKSAPRKTAKKPARRPKLRVVPRRTRLSRVPAARASKPASPRHRPFGGAIAGASAKDLALFELVRARVEVQAAIQGMVAASAETPVGEGKWNPRQILLHLYYWDREMLAYVEPAWRHDQRPPHTKNDILSENEASLGELARHDWEEARRLMQHARETLLETLQSLPEEPAVMWSGEHALGWLIRVLSNHDRHHAAVIKDARTGNSG